MEALHSLEPWPSMRGARVVVLPVGSWEQHGEALPLSTDSLVAASLARDLASRIGAVALPVLPYGVSPEHMDFPLTVAIDPVHYCLFLRDVFASLERHGVRLLIVVNGHGGNVAVLDACTREYSLRGGMRVVHLWPWEAVAGELGGEMHAGRGEASVAAYILGRSGFKGRGEPGKPGCFSYLRTAECSGTGSIYPGEYESDVGLGERLYNAMLGYLEEKAREAMVGLGL